MCKFHWSRWLVTSEPVKTIDNTLECEAVAVMRRGTELVHRIRVTGYDIETAVPKLLRLIEQMESYPPPLRRTSWR